MNAADRAQLLPMLQARRAAIADRWYETVAHTGFSPRGAADVREALRALTDQAIAVLADESFVRSRARDIGARLAQLHYVHPDALDGTLNALATELVAGLSADQAGVLHPRLAALLGAVAAGFFAESRAMILGEQDEIRRALFVTRQQAEAAEEARLLAEAAARVRTDVLNAAAHDLRLPVTTIKGYADLLRMRLERDAQPAPEWLRAQALAIYRGAVRINAMVEELLDAGRLQSGQAPDVRLGPVDVGALAQEVVRRQASGVKAADNRVVVDAAPGLVVQADQARLERVVENVLGNAIKYSPAATPVYLEARADEGGVVIIVRDHGVGIPADELPRLFTPFYRASTARGIPGIGIGLASAKSIVEQHGGRITVDSIVGQGTTVTLTLPVARGG